jgi:acetylornithine deacetylase/succinyl-diaminopimelate desuccinylase-like protein
METLSPQEQAVLDLIDPQETVDLAGRLVQIPSLTGREGPAISQLMATWLEEAGAQVRLQEVEPGRVNVLARLEGRGPGPRLLLNGHLDTKPVENMTIDPFAATVRAGRLYGRGACDMKAALAAQMVALKALARSGRPFGGEVLFGSEVGEEGGGWRFLDLLAALGGCDLAIIGEPTGLAVHLGQRGVFPILVRTRGRATHTGTADQGVNAIEKMARVILTLYALPCFHRVDPLWGRSPINVQEIHGGGKVTAAVPDECVANFDIRLNPDLPPETLQAAIEECLAGLRAVDPALQVEWTFRSQGGTAGGRPARWLPPDHPLVQTMAAVVTAVLGTPARLGGFPGGCAAGPLLERGIPAVICGPGDLAQAHSADEWVAIEQVVAAARVYALAALRLLPVRPPEH